MASDPKTIIANWFSGFRGDRGIPANLPRAQFMIDNLRKNGFVIVPIEPTGEMLSEAEMASDLWERAHHIAFGFPAELSPADRADLTAEISALCAAVRVEAESAERTKRLYDALYAMMYGWADDSVRTEAFAALKEAEPFIESAPTWDDAEAALTRHADPNAREG